PPTRPTWRRTVFPYPTLFRSEALWRRSGVVATYVTPAGEVLGPTGRLHGGGQAPAAEVEHSLLARKRRVRDLGCRRLAATVEPRSEEHTSELQSRFDLVCRLL